MVVTVLRLATKLRDRGWALGLGLLLGGALGNLTDRILREPAPLRGHVVDFLHLTHWPVFNVADIALTFAAITIILRTWRGVSWTAPDDHPRKPLATCCRRRCPRRWLALSRGPR